MRQHAPSSDPAVEKWLVTAVDRLISTVDPERILLFGSFARGSQSRSSDIDLLVVWDTDLRPVERIGRVFDLLVDAPRPVEPIVYTPAEFAYNSDLPFLRGIIQEARVLYERGEAAA